MANDPRFEAAAAAVSKYGSDLFRLAYSFLLEREDAQDAVQDAFVAYMRKAPAFADERAEKAWLLRVTANRAKNMLRRSRKHPSVELKEDTAKAEGVSDVALSLSSLPPKYRMPVHLYYYEGYSISEIARLLRHPAATVGTHLARGRELLRGILGGEYDEK